MILHLFIFSSPNFRCDFCSKPYTNYMSLRNHMRIHGQKRYMCDLCGKAFRLARYLRNHQRIHDDGPNRFDCPSCCKSYRTMLELAQHRCTAASTNQVGVCVRRWMERSAWCLGWWVLGCVNIAYVRIVGQQSFNKPWESFCIFYLNEMWYLITGFVLLHKCFLNAIDTKFMNSSSREHEQNLC